jgi:hypothetical protein
MKTKLFALAAVLLLMGMVGCSEPLSAREKGTAIGAVGGAAAGGIIGSTAGHPGAGAAIGGAFGLGSGALIGDRIQALQKRQSEMDTQLQSSQAELESQRKELERMKRENEVPRAEWRATRNPPWIVITEGKTAQGFPYLYGGVGSDEREMIEARSKAYNVQFSFAAKGGAFLSDVKLVIADAKSGELISLITDGPLFFIQLPPGIYTVSATFRNETKEIKALAVVKDKTVRRTLIWDLGEQSPNV